MAFPIVRKKALLHPVLGSRDELLIVAREAGIDDRLSDYLTSHVSGPQFAEIYNAIAFANRLGTVLNCHVTIAWRYIGIVRDDEVSAALVRWTGEFRKWAACRRLPCRYVYVHERSERHGLHTHLLTAVPRRGRAEFRYWANGYIRRLAAPARYDRAAQLIRIRGDQDIRRQWHWFAYLMKGADFEAGVADMEDRHRWHRLGDMILIRYRAGGLVACKKRVGVSRNLAAQARESFQFGGWQRGGFVSAFDRGASVPELLYTDRYFRDFLIERASEEIGAAIRNITI